MDVSPVNQELFELYINNSLSQNEMAMVRDWLILPMNELVATHWMNNHWEQLIESSTGFETDNKDYKRAEIVLRSIHNKLGFS